jgi:hypothetical protein
MGKKAQTVGGGTRVDVKAADDLIELLSTNVGLDFWCYSMKS